MCSTAPTAKLLLAKPFLKKLNWAEAIGKDGRPILNKLPETADGETYVCPGFQGGTNWFSTSFNPGHGLYYFQALERCNLFSKRTMEWEAGKGYMGGAARPAPGETFEKVAARDRHSDRRDPLGTAADERHPDRLRGLALDRIGPGVLRREQRRVHGCRRGDGQSLVAISRPTRPGRRRR